MRDSEMLNGSGNGDLQITEVEDSVPFCSQPCLHDVAMLTSPKNKGVEADVMDEGMALGSGNCLQNKEVEEVVRTEGVIVSDNQNMALVDKEGHVVTIEQSSFLTPTKGVTLEEPVIVPFVGMVFGTWEEVEELYKSYAKLHGFGVTRTQGSYRSNKADRRAITLRCESWGDQNMKQKREERKRAKNMEIGGSVIPEEGRKRLRKSKKCGCTTMLYASRNGDEEWEIKKVVLEHKNHNPTPSKAKLVKEYRMQQFSRSIRSRVLNGVDVGVSVAKMHRTIARECDGIDNMPITEKDMRHVVDARRRLKMEGGGDANALMKYFERMQRNNKDFFHIYRLDYYGRVKDVVWVDARSRAAYEDFGDVVCFNSTYLTNDYELSFANFVGVNHHGQSLLLGCALLSHEDCETFTWVFTQWLICMGGKSPKGFLTDQTAAMRKPIEEVMPETRHRWCIWHILKKLPSKFGTHEKFS